MTDDRLGSADRWLVVALGSMVCVAVANTTATAVAQPSIEAAFGATPRVVGSVIFGYVATFAVATSIYGRLGQRFGAARTLSTGACLLALGAASAALAPSLPWLVLSRMLQGAGAGAIPTLSLTIVAERFTGPRQARAIGLYVAGVGVGQAVGPLAGGALVDLVSWRAAVALGILALPGAIAVPRLHRQRGGDRNPVDLLGGGVLLLVVMSGTWLVSRPIGSPPDASVVVAILLLVGGILAGWFHVRRHPDPFVPWSVVRSPSFWRCSLLGAVGMSVFLGILTGLPLALGPTGTSGIAIGLLLLPMAVTIGLVSPRNGRVVERIGREHATSLSLASIAIGAGLVLAATRIGPSWLVAACLVLVGAGFGLLNAPLTGQISRDFSAADRSMALGTFNVLFFSGGAFGSAMVAGAIGLVPEDRWAGFATSVGGLAVVTLVVALGAYRRGISPRPL